MSTLFLGSLCRRANGGGVGCADQKMSTSPRAVRVRINANVHDEYSNGHGSHGLPTMDPLNIAHLLPLGRAHTQQFVVRSSDVGKHGKASMQTIANLLQDTTYSQGTRLGFNDQFFITPSMKQEGLTWVARRMHIEMDEYPLMEEILEIDTWIEPKITSVLCHWLVKNLTTRNVIGRATSTCVLLNKSTRNLVKMNKKVQEELDPFSIQLHGAIFCEGDKDIKIPKLQGPATLTHSGLKPRRRDIDINQHVNNVTYIDWLVEVIPQYIFDTFELSKITMEFRSECHQTDELESLAILEHSKYLSEISAISIQPFIETKKSWTTRSLKPNSHQVRELDTECHGKLQFLHLIRHARDGRHDISRARTQWKIK